MEREENGEFVLYDKQSVEQEKQGELRLVFENSKLVVDDTLANIRSRVVV